MGAVYTVDFHFTVKPMNVCPPQKKYNSEGMYGAPLEKKKNVFTSVGAFGETYISWQH